MSPWIDQDERLVQDLPCTVCQYNLRTRSVEGSCPECGHPVLDTLQGIPWRREGQVWAFHTGWVVIYLAVALVPNAILAAIPWTRRRWTVEDLLPYRYDIGWHDAGFGLLVLLPTMAVAVLLWWLTRPAPYLEHPRNRLLRWLLRGLGLLRPLAWWTVAALIVTYSERTSPRSFLAARAMLPDAITLLNIWIAIDFLTFTLLILYLCDVDQCPSRTLRRLRRAAMGAILTTTLLTITRVHYGEFLESSQVIHAHHQDPSRFLPAIGLLLIATGALMFIMLIMQGRHLIRLGRSAV